MSRIRRSVCLLGAPIAIALIGAAAAQPLLVGPSLANTPAETPATPEPSDTKRAENAEQLQVALRKLESGGATNSVAAQEVAYYQSREAVLAQQTTVEQQIADLQVRKTELETELKTAPPAMEAATCTFADLDQLKDQLAADQARLKLLADKLNATKAGIEKSQAALEECEAKRRQAQDALDKGKDAPNAAELATAAEQAQQALNLARDSLALRKREVEREVLAQQVQELVVQLQQEKVARLSPLVIASEADYQAQIDEIKKKEESANRQLQRAQTRLQNATLQLRAAQQEYDAATGDRTVLAEKLEAQRRTREKFTDEIDSLTQRLQRFAKLRLAWTHRYEIAAADRSNPDKKLWAHLKTLHKETQDVLDELAADLRMEILRIRDIRSSITSVAKKAEAAEKGPEGLKTWLDTQEYQLELTLKIHERDLVLIQTSQRVHERLLEEIGLGVEALTPKTLALGAWYQADLLWNREIAHIDEKPIRVKNVVIGIVILLGGWVLSRFLATLFAHRLLKRFRLSKDGTAAIRTLVFYSLLAIVVLSALRTVNVPLTAFTILGGALAIGVGFGSQALINNFIGGLIMLAERPVRLGERITFNGIDGVVEDVGFRCTKLRTLTDHLVTIPNSTLVNESIENIGRRRTIRRLMNITITYDTPREKVAAAVQALRDILEEKDIRERIHPIIGFEEFSPRVYFNDYNAESLNIIVLYWYAPVDWWPYMEHTERVNYRIMEEFERLGVEFAFPSRTVYVKHQNAPAAPFEAPANKGGKPSSDYYAA